MVKARCLLWDIDGVLADVAQSYRLAIQYTCAEFGVKITQDDINAEKARGNANNDWDLSLRLIQQGMQQSVKKENWKVPSLALVTEVFELLYQGKCGKKNGLRWKETLIPSRGLLWELYRRCDGKMGIITGRPRKDCDQFLEQEGIADLFDSCVCMEDGMYMSGVARYASVSNCDLHIAYDDCLRSPQARPDHCFSTCREAGCEPCGEHKP